MAKRAPSPLPAMVGVVVAALICGCGGGSAPTNFDDGGVAAVDAAVRELAAAWVAAQVAGNEEALEALYDPDYDYNGATAHHMAHSRLIPETEQTAVTRASYDILQPPAHEHESHTAEAAEAVMLRVRLSGRVSAEVIERLAVAGGGDEHDEHGHVHAVVPADLTGTVGFDGTFDVVMTLGGTPAAPVIAAQRLHAAAITYGGGVAAAVLNEVHVHPEEVHAGEGVHVHGRFAMLPPGGAIHASFGDGDGTEAAAEAGAFEAALTASETPGAYLVRVEAHGGSVESRTASITIVEREVHVHEHQ